MKPERIHDTRPMPASREATEPDGLPAAQANSGADRAPPQRGGGFHEATTSPDPLDIERLILSLERTPVPPAPTPDERPMSDGGRFVAYHATARPAQPHTEQEARRRAVTGLSVLVNVTPVPQATSQRDATVPTTPRHRRTHRRLWMGAAAAVAAGVFASVVAFSGSPGRHPPAVRAADPIAPVYHVGVVAEPTPVLEAMPRPERREGAAPAAPARASSSPTGAAKRRAIAAPPAAASTDVSQPKKRVFEKW